MKRYLRIDLETENIMPDQSFLTTSLVAKNAVEAATGGCILFVRNSPKREDLDKPRYDHTNHEKV